LPIVLSSSVGRLKSEHALMLKMNQRDADRELETNRGPLR
jgi:hypothetical protein